MAVKPCDARSIHKELAKRGKINLDNVLMIGVNCGGTIRPMPARDMIEKLYATNPDDVIKEEIDKGKFIIVTKDHQHKEISIDELEEKGAGRRENCQRCETKIPDEADLACGNWGVIGPLAGKATFVEVCSEKGAKLLDGAVKAKLLRRQRPGPEGHRDPGEDQRRHAQAGRQEAEGPVHQGRKGPGVLGEGVQPVHQVHGLCRPLPASVRRKADGPGL